MRLSWLYLGLLILFPAWHWHKVISFWLLKMLDLRLSHMHGMIMFLWTLFGLSVDLLSSSTYTLTLTWLLLTQEISFGATFLNWFTQQCLGWLMSHLIQIVLAWRYFIKLLFQANIVISNWSRWSLLVNWPFWLRCLLFHILKDYLPINISQVNVFASNLLSNKRLRWLFGLWIRSVMLCKILIMTLIKLSEYSLSLI